MTNASIYEQLDDAVEKILSGETIAPDEFDPLVQELLPIADDLLLRARPEFRSGLLAELECPVRRAAVIPISRDERAILPTLFGSGDQNFPMHRSHFVVSAALHAAAIALIFTSGLWVMQHKREVTLRSTALLSDISPYALPPATTISGGGGGGGDRDKIAASRGDAPRFAREQITPPAIVVRNNDPKLQAEPTVVGPPNITLSKLGSTGDPLTGILGPASNGAGVGGGIGNGGPGGVGNGYGAGVGAGYGGGIGGGVFRVGNGVSAPRAIYDPDPEYSEQARKAKYQGAVLLWIIVGVDGRPRDIHVQRSLGMGLDEKAVEAVRKWKFQPAMRDGQPVAVQVVVEVNFRLF